MVHALERQSCGNDDEDDDVPVCVPDRNNHFVRGGDGAAGVDNDALPLLRLSNPEQEPYQVLPVINEFQTFFNSYK